MPLLAEFMTSDDDKAALVVSDLTLPGGTRYYYVLLFYSAPEPPTSGPFAGILAIESLQDGTSTTSYAKLVCWKGGWWLPFFDNIH